MRVLRGDDRHPLRQSPIENLFLDRRTDADLHHAARIYEAFRDGVKEDRAVPVSFAEIVFPRIDMRIEMHEADGAALFGERAQQRQGDRMFAAERREMRDRRGLAFDQREARRKVAERDGEIADVGGIEVRNRVYPALRMRAVDEHAAGAPNSLRAVARAAAIGRPDVERNSGDAQPRVACRVGDAEECRRQGKRRRLSHVGVPVTGAKRKTATATAQVQRPLLLPSAAAVIEVLSKTWPLVS